MRCALFSFNDIFFFRNVDIRWGNQLHTELSLQIVYTSKLFYIEQLPLFLATTIEIKSFDLVFTTIRVCFKQKR